MATIETIKGMEPDAPAPIGWDGRKLKKMLDDAERLFADTGFYQGLETLDMKDSDPLHYEKLFSRVRGGMVSCRETALNISASPIVRELGEISFALYTPEGDNIALSTGIIVHVHTMSEAIKYMVRNGWEDNPAIRPGDVFANNQPTIGDVHNADVQTFVPIFWEGELIAWAGGVIHVMDIGASTPGGVCVAPTTRFDDGIDLHCTKIGEADEIAAWHWKRVTMQSRAPGLYVLDERCRLAGCHMIRDTRSSASCSTRASTRSNSSCARRSRTAAGRSSRAPARCSSRAATARPASSTRSTPTRQRCPSGHGAT